MTDRIPPMGPDAKWAEKVLMHIKKKRFDVLEKMSERQRGQHFSAEAIHRARSVGYHWRDYAKDVIRNIDEHPPTFPATREGMLEELRYLQGQGFSEDALLVQAVVLWGGLEVAQDFGFKDLTPERLRNLGIDPDTYELLE